MKVAKRYAKALFETALDNLEAVQNDMKLIRQTFQENPELKKTVTDPTIPGTVKQKIIQKVFENKITNNTKKLIELLANKDRFSLLFAISKYFDDLYKQHKGIKEAEIITTVPLTEELKSKILQKIKEISGSNDVRIINHIDPEIIGGFILNMDHLRYDASISGKLSKIKQKLLV